MDDPEEELENLFDELVGGASTRRRPRIVIPRLDDFFHAPGIEDKIEFNRLIDVPMIGRRITVPYAYENGVLNLVRPQRFSRVDVRATDTAIKLAMEGNLLQKHPEGQKERKLVVVSTYDNDATRASVEKRVMDLFGEFKVRMVKEEEIPDFTKEVREQAHKPS